MRNQVLGAGTESPARAMFFDAWIPLVIIITIWHIMGQCPKRSTPYACGSRKCPIRCTIHTVMDVNVFSREMSGPFLLELSRITNLSSPSTVTLLSQVISVVAVPSSVNVST